MVLTSLDLVFFYTNNADITTNTLSLGGTISPNTIPSGTINNVWDDVTGDESYSGDTEYRAIALRNTHATNDFLNVYVYTTGFQAGSPADTISFALEKPGGTPASIQLIDDEEDSTNKLNPNKFTVATGATVSWTTEGSPSNSLFFGTLNAGDWLGIWLRRVVPAGAGAKDNRSCTLELKGETTESPPVPFKVRFVVNWNDWSITKVEEINAELDIKYIQ